MVDEGEMGRREGLNDFDKDQIATARRLGWSISKNGKACGVLLVSSGEQCLLTVV